MPVVGVGFYSGVVVVELVGQEEEGGDAAAQQSLLTVGEPFFQDLVAAKRVFPDPAGDVVPVGGVIQVDVERIGTEQLGWSPGFSRFLRRSPAFRRSSFCLPQISHFQVSNPCLCLRETPPDTVRKCTFPDWHI